MVKVYIYLDEKEFNIAERLEILKTYLTGNRYEYEIVKSITHLDIDKDIIITFTIRYQYDIFKKYCKSNIYTMLDDKIDFYNYLKQNLDLCEKRNIFLIPTYDESYRGKDKHQEFMLKSRWGMGCAHNEIKKGSLLTFIKKYSKTHQIQEFMDIKHIYGVSICCISGKIIGVYTYLTKGAITTTSFDADRNNYVKFPEVQKFLKTIVKRLNINGIVEFEFIIDTDRKIYIMECTPRISGSVRVPLYFNQIIKTYIDNFHNKDVKEINLMKMDQ